jgi:hypothetical protein
MSQNYSMLVLENPQEIPQVGCRFDRFLFNEPTHLQSQARGVGFVSFLWKNIADNFFDARLSVFFEGQMAVSPLRATFGGIEANHNLAVENLTIFLCEVIEYLKKKDVQDIRLTQYPTFLGVESSILIEKVLVELGFETLYQELNHYWLLTDKTFWQNLKKGEKHILNKAKKNGLLAQRLSEPDIDQLHALLVEARTRKGFPITLTATQLARLFEEFPNDFMAYSVDLENQLAAIAVVVRLNAEVWYVFYLADTEELLKYSPTVLLLEKIYSDALTQGIRKIDMGISTVKGQRNEGLIRFKRNLGCEESAKKVFGKNLAD